MGIRSRPIPLIILVLALLFLGISGLFGGIAMLLDPSGSSIGLPPELLDNLPFDTFLLPGLYLTLVYGLLAPVIAIGLWRRANWARLAAIAMGIVLIGWIAFQVLLWGSPWALQYLYLGLGILILLLSAAVPSVKEDQANAAASAA